ncbi:hypothetical protein H8K32_02355 [Undibacterium jejuense]|uniref:Uncharacterized protein n=1 Tax=Undibacterium jejuense TaxID=1344949 RepID=A0A923HEJ5_9BURK|nr:hypothetical protein [Undibacterium jejuense]MBC3860928.1 hypothetical protein [Undibacterium jejuense]
MNFTGAFFKALPRSFFSGVVLILFFLNVCCYAHELSDQQIAAIDAHVLSASPEVEADRQLLVAYLTQGLHTDAEKPVLFIVGLPIASSMMRMLFYQVD